MVKETMEKIGKLNDVNVLPTIGMDVPYEYRNKVQVPFRKKDLKQYVVSLKEILIILFHFLIA